MADIDYGIIQRTVNDALSHMQSDVQRMMNEFEEIKRFIQNNQQLDDNIEAIRQAVQRLEQTMQHETPQNDMYFRQMSGDVADIKARLANVEKFALQFSQYLQQKFEDEKEDREYRTAA